MVLTRSTIAVVLSAITSSAGAEVVNTSLIASRRVLRASARSAVWLITERISSVRAAIVVTSARDSRIIAASPSPSWPTASPTPLRTRVRLPITPPLTSSEVWASTSSMVAAVSVEPIGIVSPSCR